MNKENLPQHIAIVMDGNGRWAQKRSLPRVEGHRAGVDAARKVVKSCAKKNIKVLSLFAFSSENWRRPVDEVNFIMELFVHSLENEVDTLKENQIQLRFIGDRVHFSDKLRDKIVEIETLTLSHTGMILIIAADYGGQWDICQAARKLAHAVEAGKLRSSEIDQATLARELSFADLPDPDLFIRTSGELRISNFMLWQLAYSELYFTDKMWPDFDEEALEKALLHYAGRERRYGCSSEQLRNSA